MLRLVEKAYRFVICPHCRKQVDWLTVLWKMNGKKKKYAKAVTS